MRVVLFGSESVTPWLKTGWSNGQINNAPFYYYPNEDAIINDVIIDPYPDAVIHSGGFK